MRNRPYALLVGIAAFFIFFATSPEAEAQNRVHCFDPGNDRCIASFQSEQNCENNCFTTAQGGFCVFETDCPPFSPPPGGPPGGSGSGGSGSGGSGSSCPASSFTIEGLLKTMSCNLNRIIPFLVLGATVVFLYGVVRYITAGDDEQRLTEARNFIVYGIIGLAVILAVWGFVAIVIDFIFGSPTIPNIPGGDVVDTL